MLAVAAGAAFAAAVHGFFSVLRKLVPGIKGTVAIYILSPCNAGMWSKTCMTGSREAVRRGYVGSC